MSRIDHTLIDCEEGRRMGCQSFCCRLLVRLEPDEMENTIDGSVDKGYVDKTTDESCIHFDGAANMCAIWDNRPRIYLNYECNSDFLL